MLLIGAVVLAGGGIGYYFKIYKPKHEAPDLEGKEDGIRPDFYENPSEDAILMSVEILAGE